MESIISTFHIDWKIMIAQAINFGIVFVALYIFALKPLAKLMTERSEKIAKGFNDAKTNAILLEQTRTEYEAVLSRAKTEANKIFQDGKKEAEARKTVMLEEAKKEVAITIENGKKMLEAEKTKMISEARNEIINLTIKATEKLIGSRVDESSAEEAIRELNDL